MKESFQALKELFHVLKELFQAMKIPFMICLQCFWDASKWFFGYVCKVFGTSPPVLRDITMQRNATIPPPKKITGRINPAPVETRPRHVSYPRRVTMDVVYIPRFLYDLYLTKIYSARKIFRPTIPPQKYSARKWTWRWRVITLYGVCRRGVGAL